MDGRVQGVSVHSLNSLSTTRGATLESGMTAAPLPQSFESHPLAAKLSTPHGNGPEPPSGHRPTSARSPRRRQAPSNNGHRITGQPRRPASARPASSSTRENGPDNATAVALTELSDVLGSVPEVLRLQEERIAALLLRHERDAAPAPAPPAGRWSQKGSSHTSQSPRLPSTQSVEQRPIPATKTTQRSRPPSAQAVPLRPSSATSSSVLSQRAADLDRCAPVDWEEERRALLEQRDAAKQQLHVMQSKANIERSRLQAKVEELESSITSAFKVAERFLASSCAPLRTSSDLDTVSSRLQSSPVVSSRPHRTLV